MADYALLQICIAFAFTHAIFSTSKETEGTKRECEMC